VVNSVFLVQTPIAYGELLWVKLGLFAGMVALAAPNRRASRGFAPSLESVRRRVILEQMLGAAVMVCVAVLGTIAPPAESAS
jgi:putative copper export protein